MEGQLCRDISKVIWLVMRESTQGVVVEMVPIRVNLRGVDRSFG